MVIVKPTPLILPDVSLESKLATLLNYLDIALIHEDAFIEKCEKATVHAISEHRKAALQELDDELQLLKTPVDGDCKQLRISNHFDSLSGVTPVVNPRQTALEATPFQDLLLQSIPVNKILVETERIFWHQRMGHPCDE